MKKIVKKWGDSYVITFTPEERKLMGGLTAGDAIRFTVTEIETKEPYDGKA
jgi:hypothetical protein